MLAVMKPGQLLGFSTLDPLLTEVDNVDLTEHSVSSMNPLHHVARMLRQGGNHSNGNESDTGTVGDGADTRSLGQLSTGVLSQMDDPTLLEDGAVPVREIPRELISEPASLPVSRDTSESNLLSRNVRRSSGGPKNHTHRASLHMHQEELRCVIAVVRHGDRTPKEKLKMNTKEPIILQYFIDHSVDKRENSTKDLKVKAKGPMVDFLGAVRKIIEKYEAKATSSSSSSSKSKAASSSSADGKDDDDTSENNKLLWKFKHMVRYFSIHFRLFSPHNTYSLLHSL
jgi:hypothetical protein